jgi:hypothetical protein
VITLNNFIEKYFDNYIYNINITDRYVDIINYLEIVSVSEKEIKIILKDKTLFINGINLLIKKLDKFEVLITGNIEKVNLYEK